ncbi:MAG: hypothetical protein PHQ95_04645 [Candidatus Gracilibacteria bacterium]|nr:hypothetical protein [Candidatus Gracilibacteria bacterium]
MKTNFSLIKQSFLVFSIFCLTTFITYGANTLPGGFLKSQVYTTINSSADALLESATNGEGAAILDGLILREKDMADQSGRVAQSTGKSYTGAYNAYLDDYLSKLDTLDNEVRNSFNTNDYSFLFQYIYPRVFALKISQDSIITNILRQIGFISGTTNQVADVITNNICPAGKTCSFTATCDRTRVAGSSSDICSASIEELNDNTIITTSTANGKIKKYVGMSSCLMNDYSSAFGTDYIYWSITDCKVDTTSTNVTTFANTAQTQTGTTVVNTPTEQTTTINSSAQTTLTVAEQAAANIAANPAIANLTIVPNKTTVIAGDTIEFTYNIGSAYKWCTTQTHYGTKTNGRWSSGISGNFYSEGYKDRQGIYSMVIDSGVTGVIIDCNGLGISTRFDGGGPDKEIILNVVSTNAASTTTTASTAVNKQAYRVAITKENCPAILKTKGLPDTIYADRVITGPFQMVQCEFYDNNTWNIKNYYGGVRGENSGIMTGFKFAGASFEYSANHVFKEAPFYSQDIIPALPQTYPAPVVSANDNTNTITGWDPNTMQVSLYSDRSFGTTVPDLTGNVTIYVRHKAGIFDTAAVKTLRFTAAVATPTPTPTASSVVNNICPAGKTCSFTATCDRTNVAGSSMDICSASQAEINAGVIRTNNGKQVRMTGQTTCDKTQFGMPTSDLVYWTVTNCRAE